MSKKKKKPMRSMQETQHVSYGSKNITFISQCAHICVDQLNEETKTNKKFDARLVQIMSKMYGTTELERHKIVGMPQSLHRNIHRDTDTSFSISMFAVSVCCAVLYLLL